MKNLIIFLLLSLSFTITQATEKQYKFDNLFSICIDTKLELRDANGHYTQMTKQDSIIHIGKEGIIIFQQKGLNNRKQSAYQTYARFIIQIFDNDEDSLYSDDSIVLSDSDIVIFNLLAYQELNKTQKITIEPTTNEVTCKNGYHCVRTFYQRTGIYGNVDVAIYYFFNENKIIRILYSYKHHEADIWENIMKKAISSFLWANDSSYIDNVEDYPQDNYSTSNGKNSFLGFFLLVSWLIGGIVLFTIWPKLKHKVLILILYILFIIFSIYL